MNQKPTVALAVPPHSRKTIYPAPFAALVEGRIKHRLGDHFSLTHFGVNLTELAPGCCSALLHHHSKQDEFIFIVSGTPTLVLDEEEFQLNPGDCCGFKAGSQVGHQLINRTASAATYLEIGDRTEGDLPVYPKDDLKLSAGVGGAWLITHKDGTPY